MTDRFTPDADAKTEAEQADVKTGTVQTGFSETGHQQMSDVHVPEVLATLNGVVAAQAVAFNGVMNGISQNAANSAQIMNAMMDRRLADWMDLAHDRQWNVNETDAYSVIAIDKTGENVS